MPRSALVADALCTATVIGLSLLLKHTLLNSQGLFLLLLPVLVGSILSGAELGLATSLVMIGVAVYHLLDAHQSLDFPATLVLVLFSGTCVSITCLASHARREIDHRRATQLILERTNRENMTQKYQLDKTNQELKEREQQQAVILSFISHELRNRLSPLANLSQVWSQVAHNLLPPEFATSLPIFYRSVQHMSRLLDNLRDVALLNLNQGRIAFQATILDLRNCVSQVVDECIGLAEHKSISLGVTLPDEPVWVNGDPTRLAQVVGNILTNALKYTDPEGSVTITLEKCGRIVVTDTGIGLDPETAASMFEMFQRGRNTEKVEGLGLGLTLVRQLVAMHGGTVRLDSAGIGQGATCVIDLPLTPPPDASPAPITKAPPAPITKALSAPASGLQILVVEDDQDTAQTFCMLLNLEGHTCKIASNAQEALALIEGWQPDIVFSDISLPGEVDGFDLAKQLRQRLPNARLVALTGHVEKRYIEQATTSGFNQHLSKPVSIESLLSTIRPGG